MTRTSRWLAAVLAVGSLLSAPAQAQLDLGSLLADPLSGLLKTRLTPVAGSESFEQTIRWDGRNRRVLVIRPSAPATSPAPAVVLLHYLRTSPEQMANVSAAGRLAAEHGAWVLMPAAIGGKWNDNPAQDNLLGADDVGFIDETIRVLTGLYPLDASRIYLAGLSNGGFMATRYACERPGRVAAAASVAATFRKSLASACHPAPAVPFLIIQGTDDFLVPYKGNALMLSAEASYQTWAGFGGCDLDSSQSEALAPLVDDGTAVIRQRVEACNSPIAVQFYTIEGGGHTWPGSPLTGFNPFGTVSRNLDATEALWQFFKDFPEAP